MFININGFTYDAYAALTYDEMECQAHVFGKHLEHAVLAVIANEKFQEKQTALVKQETDDKLKDEVAWQRRLEGDRDDAIAALHDSEATVHKLEQTIEEATDRLHSQRTLIHEKKKIISQYNAQFQESHAFASLLEGRVEGARRFGSQKPLDFQTRVPSPYLPATPMHDPSAYEDGFTNVTRQALTWFEAHRNLPNYHCVIAAALKAPPAPNASPLYSPTSMGPYHDWYYSDRSGPMPDVDAVYPAGHPATSPGYEPRNPPTYSPTSPAYSPTSPQYGVHVQLPYDPTSPQYDEHADTPASAAAGLDTFALPPAAASSPAPPVDLQPDPVTESDESDDSDEDEDIPINQLPLHRRTSLATPAISAVVAAAIDDIEDEQHKTLLQITGLTARQLKHMPVHLHERVAREWDVITTWIALSEYLFKLLAGDFVIIYGANYVSNPLDFVVVYAYPHTNRKKSTTSRIDLRLWTGDPSIGRQAGLRYGYTEGPTDVTRLLTHLDGLPAPLAARDSLLADEPPIAKRARRE